MMLFHEDRLDDVDERLAKIVREAAAQVDFNILVVCGYRSDEAQWKAYTEHKTKAKPGQSKHNHHPSLAVDLIGCDLKGVKPYWERLDLLYKLNDHIQAEAKKAGVKVIWSANWKNFVEFNHWELG